MKKRLTCKMVGYNCDFVVRNESEDSILKDYADHFERKHKEKFTKEIRDRAKSLIREAA